jgi:hypothetical protein
LFVAQAIIVNQLISSIKEMIIVHDVRRSRNGNGRKGFDIWPENRNFMPNRRRILEGGEQANV